MQSMAISLGDSLGRTARGDQELAQAQNGLSVAQRKLLGQLNSPGRLEDIARDNGWDTEYASKTASRLAELGLIATTGAPRASAHPQQEGPAAVLPLGRAAPRLSKPWPAAVAGVFVLAGLGLWWGVSTTSSSSVETLAQAPSSPAPSIATPAKAAVAEAVATRGTELPKAVYSMTLQQASPPAAAAPSASPAAPASAVPAASPASRPSAPVAVPPAKAAAPAPTVATRGLSLPPTSPKATPDAPTTAVPAVAATPAATVAAPAAVTAPEPPPKTLVAAAAPTAAEAKKPTESAATVKALKIVQRDSPSFPREAILANVNSGSVKARLTVDGSGSVTKVEILEANPRRVFDREVQRTLARWKFEPTGQTQTAETEVDFRRD